MPCPRFLLIPPCLRSLGARKEETHMDEENAYNEIPYDSRPFSQAHPNRMATIARLFDLTPADITKCRVLELGCASGGNLIPMACYLSGSEFVGVEYAKVHVEMAQKAISSLGLTNIRVKHESIMGVDDAWGQYDYIITHGVYSWVSKEVQEKILSIYKRNLAPNGIGYISYNTYPGWHVRGMLRHMMLYHVGQFSDSKKRLEQARALMDFMTSSVPVNDNYFGMLLKKEVEIIKKSRDDYLFHEHLERENNPVYFHQFAEQAASYGLEYLGEVEFGTMLDNGYPKNISETLRRISPNIIRKEQYMDFLRNRLFRQTLLCHGDSKIKRNVGPENVLGLLVASNATLENGPLDTSQEKVQVFKTRGNNMIRTNSPLAKAAFMALKEQWPCALSLDEMVDKAYEILGKSKMDDENQRRVLKLQLAADMLASYTSNVVEFHTYLPRFVTEAGEKPQASPLARYHASLGLSAVNMRHESIAIDVVEKNMLPVLDGTRTREEIAGHMLALAQNGVLSVKQNGEPARDPVLLRQIMQKTTHEALARLGAKAFLVA